MVSSKTKALVILSALILSTGIFTVGCNEKPKSAWVNTNSMPGKTFSSDFKKVSGAKSDGSSVVYLGNPNEPDVNFGPRDISFNFRDLR